MMPDRILQRDDFAAALHSRFQVIVEGADAIELELVEVSDLIAMRRQEKFSLLFQGPPHILLPQQIYRMAHAQLGEIELFIVPVGMNETGYSYEAVFNRLKE